MHEASLMANLMRRIDDIAKAERARRVASVSVWLGALSHMSVEHFTEHFKQAAAGTIAEGARLDISVSDDPRNDKAQELLLQSVEVET
jgi:hydrogenase nickel incorporation protein HypA/HybF